MSAISKLTQKSDMVLASVASTRPTQRMMTWKAIQSEVLARIRSGQWQPGQLIPTEIELAAEFGCARATINRALTSLAASGLLERRRKVGTRVAEHPPSQSILPKVYLRDDIETLGATYGYRLISMRSSLAPQDVLRALMMPSGSTLIEIRSEFTADGRPYCCETRWLSPEAVPQLTEAALATQCADEWLDANVALNHGNMLVSATNTSAVEDFVAQSLGLEQAEPLLQIQRVNWASANAISLSRQYFPQAHSIGALF